jgi:riboflavin synthase alpha subunit
MGHIISGFIINKSEIYTCTTNDNDYNSEHRKMRAKQQHVCKEMNLIIFRGETRGSSDYKFLK